MTPFRERFLSTVWVVLLDSSTANSEKYFGGGRASYLTVRLSSICMLPLTRRFTPRRSAQTKVAKPLSPSFFSVEVYWTFRFPSHDSHPSFPTPHPLTILLLKPYPPAQMRVQVAGARTAENVSPHARPTSATSNPLAVLPTGGVMGPPAAHGFRTSSLLQARGERGVG